MTTKNTTGRIRLVKVTDNRNQVETIDNVTISRVNKGFVPSCDDENPDYLFSTTWTSLLIQIANGTINAQDLAKASLANRGLDINGNWIGFAAAKKAHGIK